MKYLVVSGSTRAGSQSLKVASFIANRLAAGPADPENVEVLSLADHPLPLWDKNFPDKGEWPNRWPAVAAKVTAADAYVFVIPEWHGMVPPAFKNLLFLSGHLLAHKPALIAAVSSGMGGAYPVAELRAHSHKNNFVNYIPDHLIIRHVGELLNGETPATDVDRGLRARIDRDLEILRMYAEGSLQIRKSPRLDLKNYGNGM